MRRLTAFTQASLDGYFADPNGDLSWAHREDPEFKAFVADNAKGDGVLLFGRKTYDMMASYWPTPMAAKNDPAVAERINHRQKVVFSRTMDKASWSNTKVVKTDMATEVQKMKKETGPDMVILGSGSIVSQLAHDGLIDAYQVVLNPIALGAGKKMFDGLKKKLSLKLIKTRTFSNGNIVLFYEPAR